MSLTLTCALCAHSFDPASEAACLSCPLSGNCALVCCPSCGHVDVDPDGSRFARLLAPARHDRSRLGGREDGEHTVADLAQNERATVTSLSPELADEIVDRLNAYGLSPGCEVALIQRSPVVVVAVERTELALEEDVARRIAVQSTGDSTGRPRRRWPRLSSRGP